MMSATSEKGNPLQENYWLKQEVQDFNWTIHQTAPSWMTVAVTVIQRIACYISSYMIYWNVRNEFLQLPYLYIISVWHFKRRL